MDFKLPADIDVLELSEKGISVPILSLITGAPIVINEKPLTITVKGGDSKAYQAAQLEVERKRSKILSAGGEFDTIEATCELLAAVTTDWDGFQSADGRPAQCTPANVKELYLKAPVIRDQVLARVNNR